MFKCMMVYQHTLCLLYLHTDSLYILALMRVCTADFAPAEHHYCCILHLRWLLIYHPALFKPLLICIANVRPILATSIHHYQYHCAAMLQALLHSILAVVASLTHWKCSNTTSSPRSGSSSDSNTSVPLAPLLAHTALNTSPVV
jgi:hypothetical protein